MLLQNPCFSADFSEQEASRYNDTGERSGASTEGMCIFNIERKKTKAVYSNRLFTVLYFSVRSSRSGALSELRAAILHEGQNYLGAGRGRSGRKQEKYFSHPPPPPLSYSPTPVPSEHLEIKIPVTVRRGISKRSHEKIGDCEESNIPKANKQQ